MNLKKEVKQHFKEIIDSIGFNTSDIEPTLSLPNDLVLVLRPSYNSRGKGEIYEISLYVSLSHIKLKHVMGKLDTGMKHVPGFFARHIGAILYNGKIFSYSFYEGENVSESIYLEKIKSDIENLIEKWINLSYSFEEMLSILKELKIYNRVIAAILLAEMELYTEGLRELNKIYENKLKMFVNKEPFISEKLRIEKIIKNYKSYYNLK